MKRSSYGLLAVVLGISPGAQAANILSPGDLILAIDRDVGEASASSTPSGGGENALNVLDGSSATKYLNFGERGTGFIVTPGGGASVVQSLRLTTANDSSERDPAKFVIFGTNAAIGSGPNSNGQGEQWVRIAEGALGLPTTRLTMGAAINFTNTASFTSYKIFFPEVRNAATANSMQVADVALFTGANAGGANVLTVGSTILSVDATISQSNYPAAENPTTLLDNSTGTKYLNFGKNNSGFIVRPAAGLSVVNSFSITTAGDAEERDPSSYELWGLTGDFAAYDNSLGNDSQWTLISSGGLTLPTARLADGGPVNFANSNAYDAYKVIFPTTKDGAVIANSMQISGFSLDGVLVPEPGVGSLAVLAAFGCLRRRREKSA